MSEFTSRTVYGAYLQTCKQMGLPFSLIPYTTLNEKFGIQSGVLPDANTLPNMRYFAIGNGGHTGSLGADGAWLLTPKAFKATSAALYNHLPFVLRPLGNDISAAERTRYGLRKLETFHGATYIAYYLKRLNLTNVKAEMTLTTVQNNQSNTTPFTPDSSCLNPVAPTSDPGVTVTSGSYVAAKAPLDIIIDQVDTAEFLNVIDIIYQNRDYAMLSELALVSGQDRTVSVTDPGGQAFNMAEVIAAQVNDFANAAAALQFNNLGVKFALDVGATEPMYKVN